MPQNSNFRLTRGHRFRPKLDFTVMAPNHGGDPLGSISGPMGSHSRSLIWTKIRLYIYGDKSRWGPPSVHLGANGVPLGPKNGSKPKKFTLPQNKNFRLLRGHRFQPKFDYTVMAPNHGGDPLVSILGSMGSHWVQKWVKTIKITMPQNSNFPLSRGHRFRPKFDFTVMVPNHGGAPLVSILGPMGSHWVQKMGQNRKKLPCPKIRIFDYPAVIDFGQNLTLRLWRQITVGTP